MTDEPIYCSFCAKGTDEVRVMVRGALGNICDECVDLSALVCAERRGRAMRAKLHGAQLADIRENGT